MDCGTWERHLFPESQPHCKEEMVGSGTSFFEWIRYLNLRIGDKRVACDCDRWLYAHWECSQLWNSFQYELYSAVLVYVHRHGDKQWRSYNFRNNFEIPLHGVHSRWVQKCGVLKSYQPCASSLNRYSLMRVF